MSTAALRVPLWLCGCVAVWLCGCGSWLVARGCGCWLACWPGCYSVCQMPSDPDGRVRRLGLWLWLWLWLVARGSWLVAVWTWKEPKEFRLWVALLQPFCLERQHTSHTSFPRFR